ncbi:MAG TPA: 50S ribosomal protein L4, partial [Euryarchaeota archaeon]|nr:50S ribosomal protein L4 [Euryarchaeota archaeon]
MDMVEAKARKIKRPGYAPGKANVYALDGSIKKEVDLPVVFKTELRPDMISRASVSIRANRRQPYAPKRTAGMRHSVKTWGKGHGVARVQRLRQGSKGAQAPLTVGGRRAHPPKIITDHSKRMNRKEMRLARMSALAAASNRQAVRSRGHAFPEEITLPIIV